LSTNQENQKEPPKNSIDFVVLTGGGSNFLMEDLKSIIETDSFYNVLSIDYSKIILVLRKKEFV